MTSARRQLASVCLLLAIGVLSLPSLAGAQAAVKKPPVAKPAAQSARITPETLADILGLSKSYPSRFFNVSKDVGDSTAIYVTSHRGMIAANMSRARDNGGTYTPTTDLRSDLVVVSCGDEDLGEILECSRVTVTDATGKRVPPVTYTAGPRVFANALGNRWSVRKVLATYDARLLRGGFEIRAGEPDGTEWRLPVSATDADVELLLNFGQPAPASLVIAVQPFHSDGWRVWSEARDYSWRGCVARSGASSWSFGELARVGSGSVTLLKLSDFKPPLDNNSAPPEFHCEVGGKRHDAQTHVLAPY